MDNFKATYCGAEYHNIDGTGWPDAVVMENQGSVLNGTYESKMYYPKCTMDINVHISIIGCDDWTEFDIVCTADNIKFLEELSKKSKSTSTYGCMPTIEFEMIG